MVKAKSQASNTKEDGQNAFGQISIATNHRSGGHLDEVADLEERRPDPIIIYINGISYKSIYTSIYSINRQFLFP